MAPYICTKCKHALYDAMIYTTCSDSTCAKCSLATPKKCPLCSVSSEAIPNHAMRECFKHAHPTLHSKIEKAVQTARVQALFRKIENRGGLVRVPLCKASIAEKILKIVDTHSEETDPAKWVPDFITLSQHAEVANLSWVIVPRSCGESSVMLTEKPAFSNIMIVFTPTTIITVFSTDHTKQLAVGTYIIKYDTKTQKPPGPVEQNPKRARLQNSVG